MLEYVSVIKGKSYKLGFVDWNSPKEWKWIINHKLSEYKECAYVDSTIKMDNIVVILELNTHFNDLEFIKTEREQFEGYYERILDEIGSSEFYHLM
ncbi:MAG: hypothetical protein ACXVHY_06390 [Methanobacterium sp.]